MLDVPPGSWSRDGHTASPIPSLAASVYVDAFNRGFADGFARWGIVGEARNAVIGGWLYGTFIPVTDPDEVDRRVERRLALPGLDEHEAVARRWLGHLLPEAEDRKRRLRADLVGLADDDLATRIAVIGTATRDVVHRRFADTVVYELVAEYVLRAAEVAGWDPSTALAALARSAGEPTATTATAAAVGRVADAVAAEPELSERLRRQDGGAVGIEDLRAVPSVGDAVDDLLARHGDLLLDLDLVGPTLAERPDIVVTLVAGRLRSAAAASLVQPLDGRLAADGARALLGQEWRERTAGLLFGHLGFLRQAALELGRRLAAAGRLAAPEHALDLTLEELVAARSVDSRELAACRAEIRAAAAADVPPPLLGDAPGPPPALDLPPAAARAMARMGWYASTLSSPPGPPPPALDDGALQGVGAAPGRAEGTARVVHEAEELARVRPGDVVVCATTTAAWTPVLAVAAALVCDEGGLTSHPALIARELGIPAVVGTKVATRALRDGVAVVVDGSAGTARVVRP